jgi:hypothetical protein
MTALKTLTPSLADILSTTPASLYERVRRLAQLGLLEQTGGHGPGSGVKADASSLALLLIAELASAELNDVAKRVPALASAKWIGRNANYTWGARDLHGVVAAILSSPERARRTLDLIISRTSLNAIVRIGGPIDRLPEGSWTFIFSADGKPAPSYRIEARIGPDGLEEIAKMLKPSEAVEAA